MNKFLFFLRITKKSEIFCDIPAGVIVALLAFEH